MQANESLPPENWTRNRSTASRATGACPSVANGSACTPAPPFANQREEAPMPRAAKPHWAPEPPPDPIPVQVPLSPQTSGSPVLGAPEGACVQEHRENPQSRQVRQPSTISML